MWMEQEKQGVEVEQVEGEEKETEQLRADPLGRVETFSSGLGGESSYR